MGLAQVGRNISGLHGRRGKDLIDSLMEGKYVISVSKRSPEHLRRRWRNEREEGILEKLIIPPAFRGNFQQPLALPIESATVPIVTHR